MAEGDPQSSKGPKHDHVAKPDHWRVAKRRAALGKHLHATHIRFHDQKSGVGIDWESREHRKKHYPRHFDLQHGPGHHLPHPDKPWFPKLFGIELTNLSWWVAFLYTFGSCVWVVNGYFSMFNPESENTNLYVVGYSALVGGTLFELGGIAALLEALNAEPEVRVVPTAQGTFTVPDQPQEDGQQQQQPRKDALHDNYQSAKDGNKQTYNMAADSAQQGVRAQPHNTFQTQQTVLYPGTMHSGKLTAVNSSPNSSDQSLDGQKVDAHDTAKGYYNGGDHSYQMPVYSMPQPHRQAQLMPFQIVVHPQQAQPQQPPPFDMNNDHQQLNADQGQGQGSKLSQIKKWRWWGFKWRDMGWLGSFVQLIAATVFWIATITGVPGVLPTEDTTSYGIWDGVFWAPQVVGGLGFIISSALFMLETQRHWWQPRLLNLGWHVGFWNMIGGVGFFLSGLFGLYAEPAEKYQYWGTFFSTFWGSWSFLLGSYIQLVEAINKHH